MMEGASIAADQLHATALAWDVRVDQESVDWDAFTDWLEADDQNRACYDAVALLNADMTEYQAVLAADEPALPAPSPEPKQRISRSHRGWWVGAVAAVAVAVVLVPATIRLTESVPITLVTSSSESRMVELTGGGRALLSPSSRLTMDGNNVTLVGAALFNVPHSASSTLNVNVGNWHVEHIGTRFEVKTVGSAGAWVAVSEGNVDLSLAAGKSAVRVGAGEQALASGGTIERGSIAQDAIGSWRLGQLVYDNAPLAVVASDLTRYTGRTIAIAASLDSTRFTGSIAAGSGAAPVHDLADLLGAQVVDEPSGLTLLAVSGG